MEIVLRPAVRVLYADHPGRAVRLRPRGPHVPADADQVALWQAFADLFRSVALGHRADVQPRLGVRYFHRPRLGVYHHRVKVAVLRGCLERSLVRELPALGEFPGLARIVPELQHAAHGDVQLAARRVVHLAAEQQQVYYPLVDLDGTLPRRVVYRLYVVYALVLVVDIVEPVVLLQPRLQFFGYGAKFLLRLRVADHGRHGVEKLEKARLISRELRLRRLRRLPHVYYLRRGAAGERQQRQRERREAQQNIAAPRPRTSQPWHIYYYLITAMKAPTAMVQPAVRSASVG